MGPRSFEAVFRKTLNPAHDKWGRINRFFGRKAANGGGPAAVFRSWRQNRIRGQVSWGDKLANRECSFQPAHCSKNSFGIIARAM